MRTFAHYFKNWRNIKRIAYQNLDDLQNMLIKLTVKARAVKAWPLYEFPFSLNPSNKPNDAQTFKSYSTLYPAITEDQFQEYQKNELMGHFRDGQIKSTKC